MAPEGSAVALRDNAVSPVDSAQTLRATTALLRKIQSTTPSQSADAKASLLADADDSEAADAMRIWLILTTKKHIIDKKRLKPGKIALPHPYLDVNDETLRICLITADPQRKYKDLIDSAAFPEGLRKSIKRVIGLEKLKAKYKSFESRRQLAGEYDVFLADDRIATYLPGVLGKVFFKGGSKRPVPVSLEGKRQSVDEKGVKRRKLSEGGAKVVKSEVKPQDVANEIRKAVGSALVHLAPSTTTAVKVGVASQSPQDVRENVEAVVQGLVDKYVPQKWANVRSVHVKGAQTAALPIWMAEELWVEEKDVLEEAPPAQAKSGKKRKRNALAEAAEGGVLEVPGPDGKMRRIEAPTAAAKRKAGGEAAVEKAVQKRKSDAGEEEATESAEKAEKAARKQALKKAKEEARKAVESEMLVEKNAEKANGEGKKMSKKTRMKAADLM